MVEGIVRPHVTEDAESAYCKDILKGTIINLKLALEAWFGRDLFILIYLKVLY